MKNNEWVGGEESKVHCVWNHDHEDWLQIERNIYNSLITISLDQ